MEIDDVIALLRARNDCEVRDVVVGGVAINLHGLARATADIDLFVSPDEENVGRNFPCGTRSSPGNHCQRGSRAISLAPTDHPQ